MFVHEPMYFFETKKNQRKVVRRVSKESEGKINQKLCATGLKVTTPAPPAPTCRNSWEAVLRDLEKEKQIRSGQDGFKVEGCKKQNFVSECVEV